MARAFRPAGRDGFADGGVQTGEAVRHERSIPQLPHGVYDVFQWSEIEIAGGPVGRRIAGAEVEILLAGRRSSRKMA
jgi:hypothetical protein